ncbi:hypothetical protein AB0N07_49885 [Streptomyces sp. NPDC051172]|uniref:hypothetical protein n=1 Tax=Streptomyces sp. NPDC051172 TaxID=3155796 RepID=UPI0034147ED0
MARQSVLSRPGVPLEFWAVMHEAALRPRFASRSAPCGSSCGGFVKLLGSPISQCS